MRILIVIMGFYPEWGGTENQARLQAAELVRRGHLVDVVTWKRYASLPTESVIDGIRIVRLDRRTESGWQRVTSLLRMALLLRRQAERADVLMAHQVHGLALLAGWIALLTRRPVVAKFAGSTACASDLQRLAQPGGRGRIMRLAALPLRYRGVVVAMTNDIERDAAGAGFRRRVRIPNAVMIRDPTDRRSLRSQLLTDLGIAEDRPIVMSAGRFEPVKGFDTLLAAWPDVLQMCPRAQLILVGDGVAEPDLRALIRSLGIEGSVRLVAPSGPATDWISTADVVVIPSRAEGMSNVLLEGMAAGIPVVSTAVSGAVDLIRDGDNGRLVPIENPSLLAQAIVDTVQCPGEMGIRARETVRSRCELSQVVDRYEQTFSQILNLSPRSLIEQGAR